MTALSLETLRALAAECGLSVLGVATMDDLTAEKPHLEAWQEQGLAAEMGYMNRPADLLTSPQRLLPSAKSIVVISLFYERSPREVLPAGHGRIARYAWGRDYHKVLRRRLMELLKRVQGHLRRDIEHRVFADSVPLLERALAKSAGLGFIGKNTMAIMPKEGSFFFIGELLWNVEIEGQDSLTTSPAHCGSCSNCLTNCPTGAFVSERVLDAGRCISYLTIEKRTALTYQEREWLGEWLFGCDVCQEVCPFNFVPLKKRLGAQAQELSAQAGVGPSLSLQLVLEMRADEAFLKAFQGTAIMRAKREGLVRNASIVAANTHAMSLFPLLKELVQTDTSPLVRRHALWACAVMSSREGGREAERVEGVLAAARQDPDPGVREELQLIHSQLRNFA